MAKLVIVPVYKIHYHKIIFGYDSLDRTDTFRLGRTVITLEHLSMLSNKMLQVQVRVTNFDI